MTKGLPASGKSTWAKEMQSSNPNILRVNKDDLRAMLHNGRWSRANEKQVLELRDQIIKSGLDRGMHVIVDDTNLSVKHFNRLSQLAKQYGVRLEVKDFTDVPLEECINRDLNRTNSVGEKVIRDMHNQFLKPKQDTKALNPMVFDARLPYCVIFDLDGTLACMGDRSPYDGKACGVDVVNKSIHYLLEVLRFDSVSQPKVIIFSGRNGDSREETRKWLLDHQVSYDNLIMRSEGDVRKDSVIKQEMFDQYVKDKYNVWFIVDDRDQVVKMWRDMGLVCLQVNYGDF